MSITCINQRIINGGASININATDEEENFLPPITWEKGTTKKNNNDKVWKDKSKDFDSVVRQNSFNKTIKQILAETNNFIYE